MIVTGEVTTAPRPRDGRHVCLSYDDPGEFRHQAGAFLSEGAAAGQQVWYVGPDAPEVPGLRHLAPADVYPGGPLDDPDEQVAVYASATEDAVAAGFTGLRVAADATPFVRTPERLDAFARYEHRIDRYLDTQPFTAMCAYDRRVLDRTTVADVACLHRDHNVPTVTFRLHGSAGPGGAALAGELDVTQDATFTRALDRAAPTVADGELVVDGPDLDFIDHHGLLRLAGHARRRGAVAVLRTPLPIAARLAALLDVPTVRVEAR